MIFTSHLDETGLTIKAQPEKEEEWHGYRFDGDHPAIDLVHTEVKIEHTVKSIHPDLLGLLCMLYFFPFCKDKITFPEPVSDYFVDVFTNLLPPHEKTDGVFRKSGNFEIQNVDKGLSRFSGSKLSIALGGGIDSMAAHVLYPEAILTHEMSRNNKGEVIPDETVSIINEVKDRGGEAYSVISNGRRCITEPTGWTTWVASSATAVLLATDLDIGYIMRGTTSDSLCLRLGKGYQDVHTGEDVDPWLRGFTQLGLKHFSPVASMTEAGTMKICFDAGVLDQSVSCQKDNGDECHLCFKCFRKDLLAHALGFKKFRKSYWKRYRTPLIFRNMKKEPLWLAHIFKYSSDRIPELKWLKGYVIDIPEPGPFILPYFDPAILMAPDELQDDLRKRINKYLEPLKDERALTSWQQPEHRHIREWKSLTDRLKQPVKTILGMR
jgi:hypothetical protein